MERSGKQRFRLDLYANLPFTGGLAYKMIIFFTLCDLLDKPIRPTTKERSNFMPVVNATLPEVEQSTSRPIIFSVINEIIERTGLPKDIRIFFPGDSAKMAQAGTTIEDNDRTPLLSSKQLLFIEVEEAFNRSLVGTSAISRQEHLPVFIDYQVGVQLRPIYATTNVIIRIRFQSISKNEVIRWHNQFFMKITQLQDQFVHSFKYHYALTDGILSLLEIIHRYREAIEPYGEEFVDYVKTRMTERLTTLGDMAGKDWKLAIAETQSRILGRFNFDTLPEKMEHEDDKSGWAGSVEYEFTYEKPIGCIIDYPIFVHNRLLPKEYILPTLDNDNINTAPVRYSQSFNSLSYFEVPNMQDEFIMNSKYYKLPFFDDFIPNKTLPGTSPIFIALCQVESVSKKILINLTKLDEIQLNPSIVNFIINSEYPYLTTLYSSVIQVNLYRDNSLLIKNTLTCSNRGIISAVTALNLRQVHRVCFSIVTDLTLLTSAALARLQLYPDVFDLIQKLIEKTTNYQNDYIGGKTIMANVMQSTIIAMRKNPSSASELL
jgi:hypothetical protein